MAEPGYWMHETTGALRPAIETYLAGGKISSAEIAALRAYLRQWMAGPWAPEPIVFELRRRIDDLTSREAIASWLDDALDAGIDPL